ncbi:hypothetical protein EVAR_7287_1 [Eumeta japonica]|uniref:DUF7805 domain-containing protein n=1 Tax=Eumeta variegata TaxID=151549 RepID=A0A4C1T3I8_EUMVA|nr:hypothetical protein EVAR_7287_1 [Eumeta japonica]
MVGASPTLLDDHEWEATSAPGAAPPPAALPEDGSSEPARVVQLRIYDSPWPGYKVPIACLCDNWTTNALEPLEIISGAHALELHLVASSLRAGEDHRHLYFRASWTAEPQPAAVPCAAVRRLRPPGGRFLLAHPPRSEEETACGETPFLLNARGNRSVFLRVWGEPLPLALPSDPAASAAPDDVARCRTANRLLVYNVSPVRLLKAVCPGEPDAPQSAVHVFSANWAAAAGARPDGAADEGGALAVLWVGREPGRAVFSWMEVWRSRGVLLKRLRDRLDSAAAELANETVTSSGDCPYICPELEACTSGALWCDGVADCPGGADEEGSACGAGRRLLARLGGTGGALAAAALLAGVLLALALLAVAARRRRPSALADKHKRALAARRLTDELLCDASLASSTLSS